MISDTKNKDLITEILSQIMLGSPEMTKILEKLLNELMLLQREEALGAGPYERSEERKGYANGFKDKKYLSRLGELSLQIPQTRGVPFYPSCLEKGERVERALMLSMVESYVQGVSTRRVGAIVEELCGKEVSSSTVSKYSQLLDEEVKAFKTRRLGSMVYVYLDAQYEKVRYEGNVRDMAVLKAVGVTLDGRREVLGISCSLSEAEVHWRSFLEDLLARGLHGIQLIISDDHAGLKAARRAVLPSVKWQRCIFHLSQNAIHHSPSKAMSGELSSAVKEIYLAQDKEESEARLKKVLEKYKDKAGKFCLWLEENFIEGLTFFDFPKSHWKKLRTDNNIERLNKEQRRRTMILPPFFPH